MFQRLTIVGTVLGLLVCGAVGSRGQPPKAEQSRKAVEAVKEFLKPLGGSDAQLLTKDDSALKVFSEHTFVIARYRIYPIAFELPKGMKPSNVFAVSKDNQVQHLPDVAALQKFFVRHGRAVQTDEQTKEALAAWLTLSQEFYQDGFYKFEVLHKEFSAERAGEMTHVRGRAIVTQGGNGEINAALAFRDGKLTSATENAKLREGPRPICQATKLLDADPLVRRMAERDLLIMGLSARAYLMEQRESANPELRRAIDRLWERVRDNGW